MTSSYSHSHMPSSHVSRRASVAATAPYTIPQKQSSSTSAASSYSTTPFSPPHNAHPPQRRDSTQLSSSVPVLSREFVARRISEGESGRLKEELKCEACGKGYKHVSSLAKHLWEHTPEWNVTKKLLISKHQQVQLLEAASILVSMNEVPGSPKTVDVPPTINEEVVQFNSKYTDPSTSVPNLPSSLKDTAASPAAKMRLNSISQVPPSSIGYGVHPGSSPARFEEGSVPNGGFLDVPKKGSSSDKSSPKEHGDDDDDEGVFGEMD